MHKISIRVDEPGRGTRELEFAKPLITIGRSSGCDVRTSGDVVSSRHARLRVYADHAVIEDLNSTNGILVDGLRVAGSAEVGLNDVIQLGPGGPQLRVTRGLRVRGAEADGAPAAAARTTAGLNPNYLLAGGIGCLMLMLVGGFAMVGGTGLYWLSGARSAISSINDEERLSEAIGLVINGWELHLPKGVFVATSGTGTGFAVSADGYLITNNHVVEEPRNETIEGFRSNGGNATQRLWVAIKGELFDAKIVHKSKSQDLAVLKVDHRLPYVFRLSRARSLPRAETVCALGFPGAANLPLSADEEADLEKNGGLYTNIGAYFTPKEFEYSMTKGNVSKLTKEKGGALWVAHDTTISPGSSGGPLCLENGVVVAVNTKGSPLWAGNNFSFLLGQYQSELDSHVPGLKWVR